MMSICFLLLVSRYETLRKLTGKNVGGTKAAEGHPVDVEIKTTTGMDPAVTACISFLHARM